MALVLALGACGRFGYDPMPLDDGGPDRPDAEAVDAGGPDAPPPPDASPADANGPDAPPPPDAMVSPPDANPFPTGVVFTATNGTNVVGGTTTTNFFDACPAGQVVIGFDGGIYSAGVYIGSIRASCGVVSIDASSGIPTVKVTPAGQLAEHGATTSPTWSRHCPSDQMIFGHNGRTGAYVDQLVFVCLKLTVLGAPGSYSLGIAQSTALAAVGGTGGAAIAPERCPSGSVAVGDRGASGDFVDAFGLDCASYALV